MTDYISHSLLSGGILLLHVPHKPVFVGPRFTPCKLLYSLGLILWLSLSQSQSQPNKKKPCQNEVKVNIHKENRKGKQFTGHQKHVKCPDTISVLNEERQFYVYLLYNKMKTQSVFYYIDSIRYDRRQNY